MPIGRAADIVGVSRQIRNDAFDFTFVRPIEPETIDPAGPGFRKQQRHPVAGHANAVGKHSVGKYCSRSTCTRIVTDDPTVTPPFDRVGRPAKDVVSNGRLAEEDTPIGRKIHIVCEPHPAVVNNREPAPIGFVGKLHDGSIRQHFVKSHAADAGKQGALAVKVQTKRLAAHVSEYLVRFIVGRKKSENIAMTATAVKIIRPIECQVFRPVDLVQSDRFCLAELVVQGIRRI